jgi:hypothetical protein
MTTTPFSKCPATLYHSKHYPPLENNGLSKAPNAHLAPSQHHAHILSYLASTHLQYLPSHVFPLALPQTNTIYTNQLTSPHLSPPPTTMAPTAINPPKPPAPSILHTISHTWHLYLEPLLALLAAYNLHFTPESYFTYLPPTAHYSPASQPIYTQLSSTYLFLALTLSWVLRISDPSTQRAILSALLISDTGHIWSLTAGLQGTSTQQGIAIGLTVGPMILRGLVLLNPQTGPV